MYKGGRIEIDKKIEIDIKNKFSNHALDYHSWRIKMDEEMIRTKEYQKAITNAITNIDLNVQSQTEAFVEMFDKGIEFEQEMIRCRLKELLRKKELTFRQCLLVFGDFKSEFICNVCNKKHDGLSYDDVVCSQECYDKAGTMLFKDGDKK